MIPLVEEMLRTIIEKQLKYIKSNPDIIDRVFGFSNTPFGNNFKQYLRTRTISVVNNFPRDAANLPCYCIMLGGEGEEPESLGEYLDQEDLCVTKTENCRVHFDTEACSHYIEVSHAPVNSVSLLKNVTTNTSLQHYDTDFDCLNRLFISENCSNNDTIQISYTYLQRNSGISGTLMNTNYRIECWSDNADLTVYMYHLLKFIMLNQRQLLISNGITKPVLSGTDLEPVPDYFPTFAFRRSLVVSGQIENTYSDEAVEQVFQEMERIEIHGEVYDADIPIQTGGEDDGKDTSTSD